MANENRVAIVTGASSGMGEALSKDLVSKGWKVAMADIKPNDALAKELGENAAFFQCNVADYDSQAKMFQGVWDKFDRIDTLCANGGIVDRSSIYIFEHRGSDVIPPAPDLRTDVDFKGVVYGTQLAIHFMRRNKVPGGKIVFVDCLNRSQPNISTSSGRSIWKVQQESLYGVRSFIQDVCPMRFHELRVVCRGW